MTCVMQAIHIANLCTWSHATGTSIGSTALCLNPVKPRKTWPGRV